MLFFHILLTGFVLVLAFLPLKAQEDSQCYELLTFKEFLAIKVENDTNFIKQIYRQVEYPVAMRRYRNEGMVEIMLFFHPRKKTEVLISSQPLYFPKLKEQIFAALLKSNINRTTAFMTKIKIAFSIERTVYPREKFHLGVYNDHLINIVGYMIPDIDPDILQSN